MEEVEGWEQRSGVCGGWEFRGSRGVRGHHRWGKGPASSVHRLPRNLRKNQKRAPPSKRAAPLHKSVQEAETGEYLPIDGSTHSDPPSSR